ncbi:MAG: hypothetical protein HZB29_11120 [Nitrospinae bacterium]|nr:hypothetical protein [Nitrospinota bacterium]
MDIDGFVRSFLHSISSLEFVHGVTFHSEAFIVKGRVILAKDRFIQVYLNGRTGTVAFAMIGDGSRIWGIDSDSIRGWHEHPVANPSLHIPISPVDGSGLAQKIASAWNELP